MIALVSPSIENVCVVVFNLLQIATLKTLQTRAISTLDGIPPDGRAFRIQVEHILSCETAWVSCLHVTQFSLSLSLSVSLSLSHAHTPIYQATWKHEKCPAYERPPGVLTKAKAAVSQKPQELPGKDRELNRELILKVLTHQVVAVCVYSVCAADGSRLASLSPHRERKPGHSTLQPEISWSKPALTTTLQRRSRKSTS